MDSKGEGQELGAGVTLEEYNEGVLLFDRMIPYWCGVLMLLYSSIQLQAITYTRRQLSACRNWGKSS